MLEKYSEFYQTSKEISKNDSGETLVDSEVKLYNLDKIAEKEKLNNYKTPDGIVIKGKNIFLIEFKGGGDFLDNLNENPKKREIQDGLKLKLSESLLFVLPEIMKFKVEEIVKEYKIFYIVIVSDKVKLRKNENLERERMRFLINWNHGINFDLKKYEKYPINKIITENKNFYDKYIADKLKMKV
jgi:hypothetical protein